MVASAVFFDDGVTLWAFFRILRDPVPGVAVTKKEKAFRCDTAAAAHITKMRMDSFATEHLPIKLILSFPSRKFTFLILIAPWQSITIHIYSILIKGR